MNLFHSNGILCVFFLHFVSLLCASFSFPSSSTSSLSPSGSSLAIIIIVVVVVVVVVSLLMLSHHCRFSLISFCLCLTKHFSFYIFLDDSQMQNTSLDFHPIRKITFILSGFRDIHFYFSTHFHQPDSDCLLLLLLTAAGCSLLMLLHFGSGFIIVVFGFPRDPYCDGNE